MTASERPVEELNLAEPELWAGGPPLETFARLRNECPVHWSKDIPGLPGEPGFWSVTTADDLETVSRDWKTFSSQVGGIDITNNEYFIEWDNKSFIGMDPPKHDRIKALFVSGFTADRIAAHEPWIREIIDTVFSRIDGQETADLVRDVAQPIVSRVIHGFLGIPEEDDAKWATYMGRYLGREDPDLNPEGPDYYLNEFLPFLLEEAKALIEPRRAHPTDDLIGLLVHAEIDGQRLTDEEIAIGILLLIAAGNDSTKATYTSAMKALMDDPAQLRLLIDDPSLIPSAVEEALRMFPAFSGFRRTATRDVELGGQQIKEGDKVMIWYPSSNRDASRYENPDQFDVLRNPAHHAFGAGGRHFCLGNALARLELRLMLEETLRRYPGMRRNGDAPMAESSFINQLKTLPVRLR